MTSKIIAALTAGFVMLGASSASAQTVCGPHEEIIKRLETGYKESRTGFGLAGNGGLVELFVSEKGTWTFLFTRPDGVTCLMAAGGDWEKVDSPLPTAADELS